MIKSFFNDELISTFLPSLTNVPEVCSSVWTII